MTALVPMREASFAAFMQEAIAGYAEDNVACRRWLGTGALERSRVEFETLLPQGLATPDNYLFDVVADEGGPKVGFIWFAVQERNGIRGVYVYNVRIIEKYRRQGHAKRAFLALEPLAKSLGLSRIGLHVFGHNPGAQALYAELGYTVTGINMLKHLADEDA